MGFHHVAIATRDTKATHEFYTVAMGFDLVKISVSKAGASGWAKHFFYDTGGNGLIAFWELHDEDLPADWSTAISTDLGLPIWVNHIAFDADGPEDLAARKQRWLDHGLDVLEIDHGWCHSIYVRDPNGVLVEFCITTQPFTEADRKRAAELLADPHPPLEHVPETVLHRAKPR